MRSNYICVSGIMGSGKTTLARNLSRQMGWLYLPESRNAIAFLDDLFVDPQRWAFDSQISFFSEKAIQLTEALKSGSRVILDRSLSEDIYVFAKYFYESRNFDERSYKTYLEIAEYFFVELPSPDLVIYCNTPRDLAAERIIQRSESRSYVYPQGHFESIADRYETWIENYDESDVMKIDSSLWDYRKKEIVSKIAAELNSVLEHKLGHNEQLSLFEKEEQVSNNKSLEILTDLAGTPRQVGAQPKITRSASKLHLPPSPYVYVAAPFTGKAETIESNTSVQSGLFENDVPHGKLSPGRYRRNLIKTTRMFESLGLNALLPHRDVNEWGDKILSSFEVVSMCTSHVANCDLFFGLLGQSTGVHYEYGIAKAKNKPSIIVHCAELTDSFIAEGVKWDDKTLVLSCERLEEVPKLISGREVREFVRRNVTS